MARTKKQDLIVKNFQESLYNKVYSILEKLQEARDAVVKLPYTNEEGNAVVHRDNMDMHNLVEMYKREASIFILNLSREDEEKLEKSFPNWKKS